MRFPLRTKRVHWLMICFAIVFFLACTVAQVTPVTQIVEVTRIVESTQIVEVTVPVEVTRVVPAAPEVEVVIEEVLVTVKVPEQTVEVTRIIEVEIPEQIVEVTRVVTETVIVEVPVEVLVQVPWTNPIVWIFVPSGETTRVTAGAELVADILQAETGMFFEMRPATDYASAIEAMCTNPAEVHMSSMPALAYLVAADRGCAEAAMLSVRHGIPTYNGQFLVRSDSGITNLAQLQGKTFCRPDPLSLNGWVIPSIMLRGAGIDPDVGLANVVDAGSHDAVAASVYDGTCDVGATYVDARNGIREDYPDVMEQIVVFALEPDIPNDGFQFHPSVSYELRTRIIAGLLTIASVEEGVIALDTAYGWQELSIADDSYYDALRQILQAAGISAEDLVEGHY